MFYIAKSKNSKSIQKFIENRIKQREENKVKEYDIIANISYLLFSKGFNEIWKLYHLVKHKNFKAFKVRTIKITCTAILNISKTINFVDKNMSGWFDINKILFTLILFIWPS